VEAKWSPPATAVLLLPRFGSFPKRMDDLMSEERLARVFGNVRRRLPSTIPDAEIHASIHRHLGHGGKACTDLESKHGLAPPRILTLRQYGIVPSLHDLGRSGVRLCCHQAGALTAAENGNPLQPLLDELTSPGFATGEALDGLRGWHMGSLPQVSLNSMSTPGSSMHSAFLQACREHPDFEVEVVFHGTSEANIDSICAFGLDPSKRGAHGQAFGPGEYFARDPLISLRHEKGTRRARGEDAGRPCSRLIVFAILVDPDSKGHNGSNFQIVVVPEADRQLPIAVLSFGETEPFTHAQNQVIDLVQAAQDAAHRAAAAARLAEEEARAAKVFARVCQHLIRDDKEEAAELYLSAIDASGEPPDWATDLRPYLHTWSPADVEAWFPGVWGEEARASSGVSTDASSSASHGIGLPTKRLSFAQPMSKRKQRFQASVEELEKRACARSADADRLKTEAERTAAEAAERGLAEVEAEPKPPSRPGPTTPADATTSATSSAMRRIMMEFLKLHNTTLPIKVSIPDEANVCIWHAELRLDAATPLGRELQDYCTQTGSEAAIRLEITFGGGYPHVPPFLRVVSPRFAFHTGHVTVGGSICIEELTTSAWTPELTLEGLLLTVQTAIIEGGGRLDPHMAHVPYSALEARAAFERVARAHGWQ